MSKDILCIKSLARYRHDRSERTGALPVWLGVSVFDRHKRPTIPRCLPQSVASARQMLRPDRPEGYNELPRPDRRTPLRIILEVVREPMLALLLGGGVIDLALGDLKEALILLAFATLSVVITVVQETRTDYVILPTLVRWSFAMASANESLAGRWYVAISSCLRKETGCRTTRCSFKVTTYRPMNRC